MGVPYVITTEGHTHTNWAEGLSFDEQVFAVTEKLVEPAQLAGGDAHAQVGHREVGVGFDRPHERRGGRVRLVETPLRLGEEPRRRAVRRIGARQSIERLKEIDANLEDPDEPILSRGFDPIYFEGEERLTRHHLDRVSRTRPIFLMHASGHLATANTAMLEQKPDRRTDRHQVVAGALDAGDISQRELQAIVSSHRRGKAPPQNLFRAGGLFRLSGYELNELSGQHYAQLALIPSYKIADFRLGI